MQKVIIGLIVIVAIAGIYQLSKEEKKVNQHTAKQISEITEKTLPIKKEKIVIPKATLPEVKPLVKNNIEKKVQETIEQIPEDISYADFQKKEIKNFHAMQSQMDSEIAKIPDCLAQASTKEEAFSCNKKLLDIAKQMMPDGNLTPELENGYDENFTWNEEQKIKMIQDMDDNTAPMQDITACVNMSKNSDEMEECLALLKEGNKSK